MINISEIVSRWDKEEARYRELGSEVFNFIKGEISVHEILPEISYRTKDLLSIIRKIKKKQKEKEYGYENISDKLGVRIICSFDEDLSKVDQFIKDHFITHKIEYKKETLDFNRLDYLSNHYDVSIDATIPQFEGLKKLKDLVFEIQVRTINQHAWSTVEHGLSYKIDSEIEPKIKRRVYRLLSLYEIADDEFTGINSLLVNQPNNFLFKLLRILESKIYRYAKVDYDREITLPSLAILLGYFTIEEQKQIALTIEDFILENQEKITRIFTENRERYFEVSFLTQPEIFLVWYGIEKLPFSIDDNWNNDFDREDLDRIKSLWGRTIV